MAAADLAITIVYMPRRMSSVIRSYEWLIDDTIGLALCKIVPTLHLVSIKVSMLTLVFLSVERFLAVSPVPRKPLPMQCVKTIGIDRRPRTEYLRAQTQTRSGREATFASLTSIKVFGSSKGRKIFDNVLAVIFYAIPLCLIVLLYIMVAVKLKRRDASGGDTFAERNGRRRSQDKMNNNVFKMPFAVTVTFFIAYWLSYFVMRKGVIGIPISCNVQFIRYFLAHSNSAITPCLYIIFSQKYRSGFESILKRLAFRVPGRVQSGTTFSLISGRGRCAFVQYRGISLVRLNIREEWV